MRIGVQVPHFGPNADPDGISRIAAHAESQGLDSVWVSDHVVFPGATNGAYPHSDKGLPTENLSPIFEALTTLSYVAGRTERVRLGTSILLPSLRNPVLGAKMIATLDALSAGRLVLGVGAGWLEAEFELLNAPPFAQRGKVLEEVIEIWQTLWSDRRPSFRGHYFNLEEMIFDPPPAQKPRPPIWIGGNSDIALRRAARLGDGWHGARLSPEEYRERVAQLTAEIAAAGREPDEVEPSFTCIFRLSDEQIDPARLRDLVGGPELVAAQLRRYEEAGARTVVLGLDPRLQIDDHERTLGLLQTEILPRVEDILDTPPAGAQNAP